MYITNYNLNRLLYTVNASEEDISLLKILFDEFSENPFRDFFNTYELRRLAGAKLLFDSTTESNGFDRIEIVQLHKIENTDDYRFLYYDKDIKPAYHTNCHCERLNSDFHNALIPKDIQEIGRTQPKIIELYRSIYSVNLEEADFQALANVFRAEALQYGINIPEASLPQSITLKNSKPTELPNPKLAINHYLQKLEEFKQQGEANEAIYHIYRWRYLFSKKRDAFASLRGENYVQANKKLSQLKRNLYSATISYLKLITEFNQENFDANLLEKCGFIECRNCH